MWFWESARVLGRRSCFLRDDPIQDRFRRFSGTIVFLFFMQNRRSPVENKFIPLQKNRISFIFRQLKRSGTISSPCQSHDYGWDGHGAFCFLIVFRNSIFFLFLLEKHVSQPGTNETQKTWPCHSTLEQTWPPFGIGGIPANIDLNFTRTAFPCCL